MVQQQTSYVYVVLTGSIHLYQTNGYFYYSTCHIFANFLFSGGERVFKSEIYCHLYSHDSFGFTNFSEFDEHNNTWHVSNIIIVVERILYPRRYPHKIHVVSPLFKENVLLWGYSPNSLIQRGRTNYKYNFTFTFLAFFILSI